MYVYLRTLQFKNITLPSPQLSKHERQILEAVALLHKLVARFENLNFKSQSKSKVPIVYPTPDCSSSAAAA